MTTRNGTDASENPPWAMRQLRAAIGRGGSVEVDGFVYSVERARARYSYGGDTQREDVLVRRDAAGNYVALEWPRHNGQKARDIRISVTASGEERPAAVSVKLDTEAQAAAIAAAAAITMALYTALKSEAERYITALEAYTAAVGKGLKALDAGIPEMTKTTPFGDSINAVLTLRNERLVGLRSASTREATRLAERVTRTMTTQPESVAAFAQEGFTVATTEADYSSADWTHLTHSVAMLTKNGEAVHPEPARAPGNPDDRLTGTGSAGTEAMLGFLAGAAKLVPIIESPRSLTMALTEDAIQERIDLIKDALGSGGSVAGPDAQYSNRAVGVRWGESAGSDTNSILFRVPPRDPRIPAALRLDTAVEWPVDGQRAVALVSKVRGADAQETSALREVYGTACSASGDTLTCVDVQPDTNGRLIAARDADIIARQILTSEMARYNEYRELLVNSPVDSGRAAAAAIDATLPSITDDTPLRVVVDTVKAVRNNAIGAAEAAMDREADAVAEALYGILSNGGDRVYEEGRKRGYDLRGFDAPYETRKGIRWQTIIMVSHKDPVTGEPVPLQQPPSTHPDFAPSALTGSPWPKMDHATAARLLRDAIDLQAIMQGRSPAQRAQPERDGL